MFSHIYNLSELSIFLNLSDIKLKEILCSKTNYYYFNIPKKHGGLRKISAPKVELKRIQILLKQIFEKEYNPKPFVHGFVKGKSTYTNALTHVNNQYLLNIDLLDFFPSIKFSRVRALLEKPPFNASKNIATALSNLLTNKTLVQGSPCSPIISNMICRRMDNRLYKYCKKYNASYTRYADDITISWNEPRMNKFFYLEKVNKINDIINLIIDEEGFKVNDIKTFYSKRNGHKEVTGVIVNQYPNTPKDYFYRLRSIVNDAAKNGIEDAYKHYCEKHNKPFSPKNSQELIKIIKGMFNYYKMIVNNEVFSRERYINISNRINNLLKEDYCNINHSIDSYYSKAIYLLKRYYTDDFVENQTSTIFRYGKYLITCKHCLIDDGINISDNTVEEINEILNCYKYTISLDGNNEMVIQNPYLSKKYDLAIFKADDYYDNVHFCKYNLNVKIGDDVIVIGYPDYITKDKKTKINTKIVGERVMKEDSIQIIDVDYYTLNCTLQVGLSGGPVIDNFGKLVGMVVYGCDPSKSNKNENGVIFSKYIKEEIDYIEKNNYFK